MPSYRMPAFDMRLILLPKYGIPPLMAEGATGNQTVEDDDGLV